MTFLARFGPLVEYLQKRYKDVYNPSKELAVDKAMIHFKGPQAI